LNYLGAPSAYGYTFRCDYHENAYYECVMNNVKITDESDSLEEVSADSQNFKVEKIVANDSVMRLFPAQMMALFVNLKILHLRLVKLEQMNQKIKYCSRLEEIDLSDNKLTSLTNVFGDCTRITVIYLEYNNIKTVSSEIFGRLQNLKYLWLQGNSIENVEEYIFKNNTKLRSISLRNNRFSQLSTELFKNLVDLKDLYLSRNPYQKPNVITNLFEGLKNLATLRLSASNVYEIFPYDFHDLLLLEVLQLDHNFISYLNSECLNSLTKLQQLILNDNHIKVIDSRNFQSISSFETANEMMILEFQDK
jgi:Leucine-rich repeat (LRR) protein